MKLSSTTCDKLLVLFDRGYNSNASVTSYYNIMCGLLDKREYKKEKDIPDKKTDEVEILVSKLKKLLAKYWDL
jgi:hypothetical protein